MSAMTRTRWPFSVRPLTPKLLAAIEPIAKKRGAYFLLGYAVAKSTGMQKALKHLGYHRGQMTVEWSKGLY